MRYCGRQFLDAELAGIRRLIAEDPNRTRWAISQRVCETLGWRTPDGGLQEMSCRVALLRMQEDGLVRLPPPVCTPVSELRDLRLQLVASEGDSRLWNEYVDRVDDRVLALLGFGAAAWKTAPRDAGPRQSPVIT